MKQYKIGMYGGKFLPFHKGHRFCVETAAQECETVYVILFLGGADEEQILQDYPEDWLSAEQRILQMRKICRDASGLQMSSPLSLIFLHCVNRTDRKTGKRKLLLSGNCWETGSMLCTAVKRATGITSAGHILKQFIAL